MKKSVYGRKFKRSKNERSALFKGLMSSLILHERIQTTEAKAKAIRPAVEKLVTKALRNSTSAERVISGNLNPNAVEKLIKDVAPRFKDRKGGYTRIVKIGNRLGDEASMVVLEWVEMAKAVVVAPDKKVAKEKVAAKPAKKVTAKKTTKKPAIKKPATKSRKAK